MADEPLQALLFAPHNWYKILDGSHTSTIRKGTRNYRVGKPILLCCHIANMCIMADVTLVTQCQLADLMCMKTIYADSILTNLRKYYPDIELISHVTEIRWNNIRGSLCGN